MDAKQQDLKQSTQKLQQVTAADYRFSQTFMNLNQASQMSTQCASPRQQSPRQMLGLTAVVSSSIDRDTNKNWQRNKYGASKTKSSPTGMSGSISANQANNGFYRGSLNPKRWRASYDTNEISDLITMQQQSGGGSPRETLDPRNLRSTEMNDYQRFRTSNQNFFAENKLEESVKNRHFGPDQQRKMRYAIDICDPAYIK